MNSAIVMFGVLTIIFGVIASYLLVSTTFRIGKSMIDIQDKYASMIEVQKNQIYNYGMISATIILIGILITWQGFRR
jgi:archaellum component FlaG (FlaF/FlaG flagellin family)